MTLVERIRDAGRDVAHAARTLRGAPGYSAMAALAFALGIGATTAVASVVHAVLLRQLPYDQPERIAWLWQSFDSAWTRRVNVSVPELRDYEERARALSAIGGFLTTGTSLSDGEEPERVRVALVTRGFFDVLGVRPLLGRVFSADEALVPFGVYGLLGERLWRRKFGADRSIVGRAVLMGGRQITIVGVMPKSFAFPRDVEVWRPLVNTGSILTDRSRRFIDVIVRTQPGVSLAAASRDVNDAEQGQPEHDVAATKLVALQDELVGNVRPAVFAVAGAVVLVLLIACANVANLMLVRATGRSRELAVRTALGATRGRLIRQLLLESTLLSVVGAAGGVALAWWGVRAVALFGPSEIPRLAEVTIDRWVLGASVAITLVTALIAGFGPALSGARAGLAESLSGTRTSRGVRTARVGAAFVVAEIALSVTLLVSAMLLGRTFASLLAVEPGFRQEQLLTVKVALPFATYPEQPRRVAFFEALLQRIRALPGVTGAGATSILPISAENASSSAMTETNLNQGRYPEANVRVVTNGYLEALGVPLLEGRTLDAHDGVGDALRVTVVNASLARRLWPGELAVGKRVSVNAPPDELQWREVVGVVGDIRQAALDAPPQIEMYEPHAQTGDGTMALVIRTGGDPLAMVRAIRGAVRSLDPNLPVYDVKTMEQHLGESIATRRFDAFVLALFSVFALVLAGVGVYGVMSYSVAQRTRALGVRLALGARRADVSRLVLRSGMGVAATGVAIGTALALAATRLLSSLLYGVQHFDLETYLTVAGTLAVVTVLASWIPAWRASRVDPVQALRAE